MAEDKPRVYLIDASIYIFRAWYSVPDTLYNDAGQPINALHGFAGFLADFLAQANPEHLAVDEHGEHERVQNGDRRRFGGGKRAAEYARQDDHDQQ